jgi:hypothetical protein
MVLIPLILCSFRYELTFIESEFNLSIVSPYRLMNTNEYKTNG